jgi:hypothetical protein
MVADLCIKTPRTAGPFFYLMANVSRKVEPRMDDAMKYRWHHGRLDERREYFVLEYPVPPPVDMSNVTPEEIATSAVKFVLAPHFSGIVKAPDTVQYFVLGQAPLGGGTTLRCILPTGMNCNLGPGPRSELPEFLNAIRDRHAT